MNSLPLFTIHSQAPIRICDNGGWTDTWFAQYGRIFNIAVSPYTKVEIQAYPREAQLEQVGLSVSNYGDKYAFEPGHRPWLRHPLLEAAIAKMGIPENYACHITVGSDAPPGMSTGTSAAVTVALIGALDMLNEGSMTRHDVAYAAHAVETDMLDQQSGIQDQLASAYGGINYITMHVYPQASVMQLQASEAQLGDLEKGLVLIFLGKAHSSSEVHHKVIADLENIGPEDERLAALRQAAEDSRDAVLAGDWPALGAAMKANIGAQLRLHPELVSGDAQTVIQLAQQYGALGWKVNGAGGEGGSLTILCDEDQEQKQEMLQAIEASNTVFKVIPIQLDLNGLVCSKEW